MKVESCTKQHPVVKWPLILGSAKFNGLAPVRNAGGKVSMRATLLMNCNRDQVFIKEGVPGGRAASVFYIPPSQGENLSKVNFQSTKAMHAQITLS